MANTKLQREAPKCAIDRHLRLMFDTVAAQPIPAHLIRVADQLGLSEREASGPVFLGSN